MDKDLKDKIDATIEEGVKEAKSESEAIEKVVKRSVAFAPPQIITTKHDGKFSYTRLIKAMASNDWSDASFEKEAIQKDFPSAGIYGPTSSTTHGGYLVPPEYSVELIDLLTAQAVVRQAGASVYPMQRDTLYLPTMTAGATTTWGPSTEGTALTPDATTAFGQTTITAKKLYCFVGISNELLADSSPAVETIVRRDIVRELALAEDKAFLMAQSNAPVGLLLTAGTGEAKYGNGTTALLVTNYRYAGGNATTPVAAGGTITYDDIMDAMYQVESQNAKVTGFIMHPRTKNTLRKIQDSNGQYIYAIHPEQKVPDTLYGLPVHLTTQVGITFDSGYSGDNSANLSYVLLGDWSEFIIGQRAQVELAVSEHVGFYSDTTWIRATLREGIGVKHEKAFGVILDVAA